MVFEIIYIGKVVYHIAKVVEKTLEYAIIVFSGAVLCYFQ